MAVPEAGAKTPNYSSGPRPARPARRPAPRSHRIGGGLMPQWRPDRRARRAGRPTRKHEEAAMSPSTIAVRIAAVPLLALACSTEARAQDWDWVVAPYLWMSSIDTDL